MKTACVLVAILALTAVIGGCRKRDPKPAPQVAQAAASATTALGTGSAAHTPATNAASHHRHPAGIAWFQGGFEEGFSRVPSVAAPARSAPLRVLKYDPPSGAPVCAQFWLVQFGRLGL